MRKCYEFQKNADAEELVECGITLKQRYADVKSINILPSQRKIAAKIHFSRIKKGRFRKVAFIQNWGKRKTFEKAKNYISVIFLYWNILFRSFVIEVLNICLCCRQTISIVGKIGKTPLRGPKLDRHSISGLNGSRILNFCKENRSYGGE